MKAIYPLVGMHYRGTEETVRRLSDGAQIEVRREPNNPYDKNAIQVMVGGTVVGYIKRSPSQQRLAAKLDRANIVGSPATFVAKWGAPQIEIDEP